MEKTICTWFSHFQYKIEKKEESEDEEDDEDDEDSFNKKKDIPDDPVAGMTFKLLRKHTAN